jgi:hypothetical protein
VAQGHLKLDGSGLFVSYLGAFFFVAIGLWVGLPPSIETTFDLAVREIRIRRPMAIMTRQTIVPFATVEGLGLREFFYDSGSSYSPELRTLDGTIHKLSAEGVAYFHANGLLEQIRHATGLPRLDWPAGSAKPLADRPLN